MKRKTVFVVGGANLDLFGTSFQALHMVDSNPGVIGEAPGGVGRNIAETLARMNCEVQLVTALGTDLAGEKLWESCKALGIGLDYAIKLPNKRTGTFLCINHPNGDLFTAVSDMRILDTLSPQQLLDPCRKVLNQADLVVADANLPCDLLEALGELCQVPLVADPVSAAKAVRLRGCLRHLFAIKPNRAEAQALTGIPLEEKTDLLALHKAAESLLQAGVSNVFITLGKHGVYYDNGKQRGLQQRCPGFIVTTTGCGDAFLSASALALIGGETISQAALWGQAAAALCAESAEPVSSNFTMENILKRAALVYPSN